jgi:pilus assembly protein Flp/PilA
MTAILNAGWQLKTWQMKFCKDTRGQDLTEYALMAGFVALALAATMPDIATNIVTIMSKVVIALGSTDPNTAPGG